MCIRDRYNRCPGLLGDRTGQIQLQAQPARGARVLQKRQKHATGMVRIARGEQTDAVFAASRQHRMGERDFAMIEDDHRDILERQERRLFLFNDKPELITP